MQQWRRPTSHVLASRTTSCLMAAKSWLAMSASVPLRSCSSPATLGTTSRVYTSTASTRLWSVIVTLEETCSRMWSSPAVQLCLRAWPRECGTKFISWRRPITGLRCWPHQSVSTLCGWAARFFHHCRRSRPCGSPSRSTTKMVAPKSSTASVSD